MLQEGQPAPDFTLDTAEGRPLKLSSLRGRPVVVYFYPKDDTPGCTREACGFRDARARLAAAGAVVLGISPDSVAAHQRFRDKHQLDFSLLSDPDKRVASAWGAWGEKVLYGKKTTGMIRSTFVLDGAGVVRMVFPRVRVDGHVEKVLESLKGLD